MGKILSRMIQFVKVDVWRIRLRNLPRNKSFLIKQLRIILLALRGFDEDKCQLKAAALTFYSLLATIPILAVAFGIAEGFRLQVTLQTQLLEKFPGQEEVLKKVFGFADTLLEHTKGYLVAGMGVLLLLWTVVKALGNIERSFNDIWGVKKPRRFARRLSDYLFMMIICPLLFIVSSSVTVFIAGQIKLITERIDLLGAISPFIFASLKLSPYCVIWVLFTFIYIFMPNTRVNFRSGLLAGIAAGTIYQIVQWVYINFQIGVARNNAIYGSFAALPLFLVWLQLSWLIVLLGAEISFAHQNVDTYEFEPDCLRISNRFKKLVALRVTHLLLKKFCAGEKPSTAAQISHTLEIPIRLVRQVLFELADARMITETVGEGEREVGYQPAHCPEKYTVEYVVDALDERGSEDIPVAESPELEKLSQSLRAFDEIIHKSPANVSLMDV